MPAIYAPYDHVEFVVAAIGPRLTGRVVSFANPGPGDDGNYFLYTVMLDRPFPGYDWPAMTLPGAQLRKLSLLDSMAIAARAFACTLCNEIKKKATK